MTLMSAKIILTNIDLIGTIILIDIKKIFINIDQVGIIVLVDANNFGRRKKDLDKH